MNLHLISLKVSLHTEFKSKSIFYLYSFKLFIIYVYVFDIIIYYHLSLCELYNIEYGKINNNLQYRNLFVSYKHNNNFNKRILLTRFHHWFHNVQHSSIFYNCKLPCYTKHIQHKTCIFDSLCSKS